MDDKISKIITYHDLICDRFNLSYILSIYILIWM